MSDAQSPGDVEPDGSVDSMMSIILPKDVLEKLIEDSGLYPTAEIRLTIAQELRKFAPLWLEDTVKRVAGLIKYSN